MSVTAGQWHRPSGAGEDRNFVGIVSSKPLACPWHRPSGAGEDRNAVVLLVLCAQLCQVAPALRGR